MKTFLLAFALHPVLSSGQGLVGQDPQNRTLLLEEYTAINCGNCPAGHALAENLLATYPGVLTAVELHGGGLAEPVLASPNSAANGRWISGRSMG